jgi:hypothetical protein
MRIAVLIRELRDAFVELRFVDAIFAVEDVRVRSLGRERLDALFAIRELMAVSEAIAFVGAPASGLRHIQNGGIVRDHNRSGGPYGARFDLGRFVITGSKCDGETK